jgi:type I restriction enzyme S subunit
MKITKRKRIIPHGWKSFKIGAHFELSSGATPLSSNREYYDGGNIPWINSGELSQSYIDKAENFITMQGFNNSSTKMLSPNTVLVAMYGATAGKASLLRICACTNQAICAIHPNDKINALFLKYSIDTLYDYLVSLSSGSARDNISQQTIADLSIIAPSSVSEQLQIISILGLIDRKIALNREINRNLEAMAKQLYDYWFVQFDFPDENGRPYKSSGGKMVWNEKLKREIPEGWSSSNLRNLLNLFDYQRVPLSNIQRESRKGKYPYYGATGIMDYIDDFIFDGEYLLLAEDGSTSDCDGHPIVQYIWGKNWVNNHAHIIRPLDNSQITYFFHLLRAIPAKAIETGSIQKKISQENLLGYSVVDAPISLIQQFSMAAQKLQDERMQSVETINRLQKLRDELLPLLMNGQVSVTQPAVNCDL